MQPLNRFSWDPEPIQQYIVAVGLAKLNSGLCSPLRRMCTQVQSSTLQLTHVGFSLQEGWFLYEAGVHSCRVVPVVHTGGH